jgi:PEGA domain
MNPVAARTSAPPPVVFRDAFGERRRIVAPTGSDALDVLCLRSELTAVPSFEFSLRERVSRLAGFRHPYFAQVRTVERLSDTARTLALISNAQTGVRVSELLAAAAKHDVVLDSDAALCLIRQLVTAMATFHEQAPDAAHGALGPERVIVTPHSRLVIVEHVMGSAIEQLQYSEDRYWRELRVPCPRAAGLPVIDHRADALQLGMFALSLLLRRSLNGDEFPSRVGDAVVSARAVSADGHVEALPSGLRPWLTSALQLDPRTAFASAIDAREELENVFETNDDLGAPSALDAFLARYHERVEITADPAPHVSARPPVAPEPVAPASPVVHVQQIVAEPPAPEPVMQYFSPSLERERVISPSLERERVASPLLERISAPPVAPEPLWPEPKHAVAQEPLRPETAVRDPFAVTPVPHEHSAESPSLAARLNRSVEPAHKPLPSHVSLSSNMQMPLHVSMTPHAGPLHERAEEKEPTFMASRRKGGGSRAAVAAILLLLLAGGGTMAARRYLSTAAVTTGTVVVSTNPPGAQVFLDGKSQGVAPTTLTVEAGTHVLELRGAGEPRTMTLDVAAGAQLSQYLEMAKGPLAAGSLQVRTDPAGARVSVDGVARGSSPLTVADLAPGEHTVVLDGEGGSTRQIVTVEAGGTASLVANLSTAQAPTPSSSGGWISVSTPKTVQLLEDGRLLGSSDSERVMVPAGTHQLEFVNEALGYRSTKTVQVSAGRVSAIKIEFPKGTIALNAIPWADVWIDGEKAGETPIGNLPLTIGTHEIIFRHPELGERRQLATVTLTAPARVSVDMRKTP